MLVSLYIETLIYLSILEIRLKIDVMVGLAIYFS